MYDNNYLAIKRLSFLHFAYTQSGRRVAFGAVVAVTPTLTKVYTRESNEPFWKIQYAIFTGKIQNIYTAGGLRKQLVLGIVLLQVKLQLRPERGGWSERSEPVCCRRRPERNGT